MRRFLNKLLRASRTTNSARGARRAPRGAAPQVEGLEDRLVLSTASLVGSTLKVVASPSQQITFEADKAQPSKLDVLDDGALLGRFSIASIKSVTVSVAGSDSVTVINDSNGLPFATGVNVSLSGTGASNSLKVKGSRADTPGELEGYTAGDGVTDGSLVTLAGNTFQFSKAISSVTDSIASDGMLVDAFGSKVRLSGSNGHTQTLSGLSLGGAGGTFTFSNKSFVGLTLLSANATANLNATAAAAGEQTFSVDLKGNDTSVNINATPSTVSTIVLDTSAKAASVADFVNLGANSGAVTIDGSSSTFVSLGQAARTGGFVTSDIKANVTVNGVKSLVVDDSGNRTTKQNVQVSPSTITGTGLFGSSAVKLTYSDTAEVAINTGQLFNSYTVSGSHFSSLIEIANDSPAGLTVTADLNGESGLRMILFNNILTPRAPAALVIHAPGGTFSPVTPTFPSGSETVKFAGGLTSSVSYEDFTSVGLFNN